MAAENFGSAFVEVCSACRGLWFDAGELGRIRQRPLSREEEKAMDARRRRRLKRAEERWDRETRVSEFDRGFLLGVLVSVLRPRGARTARELTRSALQVDAQVGTDSLV